MSWWTLTNITVAAAMVPVDTALDPASVQRAAREDDEGRKATLKLRSSSSQSQLYCDETKVRKLFFNYSFFCLYRNETQVCISLYHSLFLLSLFLLLHQRSVSSTLCLSVYLLVCFVRGWLFYRIFPSLKMTRRRTIGSNLMSSIFSCFFATFFVVV